MQSHRPWFLWHYCPIYWSIWQSRPCFWFEGKIVRNKRKNSFRFGNKTQWTIIPSIVCHQLGVSSFSETEVRYERLTSPSSFLAHRKIVAVAIIKNINSAQRRTEMTMAIPEVDIAGQVRWWHSYLINVASTSRLKDVAIYKWAIYPFNSRYAERSPRRQCVVFFLEKPDIHAWCQWLGIL